MARSDGKRQRKPDAYARAGVNYDHLDGFKRLALAAGRPTLRYVRRFGSKIVEESIGESVTLIRLPDGATAAHLVEGLGTKNLVADGMLGYAQGKKTWYDVIGQDAAAMILNDMATSGVQPVTLMMEAAVGRDEWFKNGLRNRELVRGWKRACQLARCAYTGGETPALRDIVEPNGIVLSGSAFGYAPPGANLVGNGPEAGDSIIVLASSGLHANGLTLCRKIAAQLPSGYMTDIGVGDSFGHAILRPTHIYTGAVRLLLDAGISVHYGVNITGHGSRKFMRHLRKFDYYLDCIPKPHPVFDFIQREGKVSREDMYGTFNMGMGFALYVSDAEQERTLEILDANSNKLSFHAFRAGVVQRAIGKQSRVILDPSGNHGGTVTFKADTMQIR